MNIGEILIRESSNLLLLIPVVIGLVMLMRWFQGRAVFTQRDWLFLTGQPRGKVLSRFTCGSNSRCYGSPSCLSASLMVTFSV